MTTKMKPAIKAVWIKNLRSGEYKQGKGALRRTLKHAGDKYCCFGVLCDLIAGQEDDWHWFRSKDKKDDKYYFGYSQLQLPFDFREQVGISSNDQTTLVMMNDGGRSFDEIADWIEENL